MSTEATIQAGFDVCACFRLRKLTRQVTQLYDRALEPGDLTVTQFSLLGRLQTHRDLSVGDLADVMMMDSTTLTRLLRPLEQRGLVALEASRDDRRRRVVALTKDGLSAWRRAVPMWRKAQKDLAKRLGEQDFAALQGTVARSLDQFAAGAA